jgi:protein-disulfide isomerase
MPSADVIVLEFGSVGCSYCREFHTSILPLLNKPGPRQARFLFVALDTLEPFAGVVRWAKCASATSGVVSAIDSAFKVVRKWRPPEPGQKQAPLDGMDPGACSNADSAQLIDEARRARRFGVRGTPTFLVGIERAGEIRGWFVEGMKAELLLTTIDSVRMLIAASEKTR